MVLGAISNEPLAPVWFVLPMTVMALGVVVLHLRWLITTPMPESRRRIRGANGVMMLIALPLSFYALAMVPPSEGRAWVLSWMLLGGLVAMMMLLAWLDVFNNYRLMREERRELARELAHNLREKVRAGGEGSKVGVGGVSLKLAESEEA